MGAEQKVPRYDLGNHRTGKMIVSISRCPNCRNQVRGAGAKRWCQICKTVVVVRRLDFTYLPTESEIKRALALMPGRGA